MSEEIKLDNIVPNSWNPNTMSEKNFEALKTSIEVTNGDYLKNNPLKVRKVDGYYEIIDGEHRWKVCKELGWTSIKKEWIEIWEVSEDKARPLTVVLNKDRGHINYFKLSKMLNEDYDEYARNGGMTQKELGDMYGYERVSIANILPIYPRLQKCCHVNTFSNAQLEALARVRNDLLRDVLLERTIERKWKSPTIRSKATTLNEIENYVIGLTDDEKLRNSTITSFVTKMGEDLLEFDFSALKNELDTQFLKQQNQRIIHGDMFEVIDRINDDSIDCILTDPPYAISLGKTVYDLDGRKNIKKDVAEWDHISEQDYLAFTSDWLDKVLPKLKSGGSFFIFTSDKFLSFIRELMIKKGLKFRATITWHKTNPAPSASKDNLVSSIEYILYASKGKPTVFNWLGQNKMHNFVISELPDQKESVGHPTQKPLKVINFLLKFATNSNDVVLDPFAGSGTTAVACKELSRSWVVIEREEKYINLIERRVNN